MYVFLLIIFYWIQVKWEDTSSEKYGEFYVILLIPSFSHWKMITVSNFLAYVHKYKYEYCTDNNWNNMCFNIYSVWWILKKMNVTKLIHTTYTPMFIITVYITAKMRSSEKHLLYYKWCVMIGGQVYFYQDRSKEIFYWNVS